MAQTHKSTDPTAAALKVAKGQLRTLRKQLKVQTGYSQMHGERHRLELAALRAQIASTEDKTLPAKTALLKELAYLVQATSRAVRTTMWSLAPTERRGGR